MRFGDGIDLRLGLGLALFCSAFGASASTSFGGSGFFSTGFGVWLRAVGAGVGHDGLSCAILPTASSIGLASATFSTIGFGSAFVAGFDALGDARQLIGGDDLDRHGVHRRRTR